MVYTSKKISRTKEIFFVGRSKAFALRILEKCMLKFSLSIHKICLVLLFLFSILASNAASYTSTKSGLWSDPTVWSPNGVPVSGDNVTINGHTITCSGDLNWNSGTISGNINLIVNGNLSMTGSSSWSIWGTFNVQVSGNYTNSIGGISLNGAGSVNVGGSLNVSGDVSLNSGDVYVGQNCTITGSVNINNSRILSVGGSLTVSNSMVVNNGVIDVDGNVSSTNITVHTGTLAVDGDLTKSGNFTVDNSGGDVVIVGDYISTGGTTSNPSGDLYVLGGTTGCTGDCGNIQDFSDWITTTPALPYLTSVTGDFDVSGTFTVPSGVSTLIVECWGGGGGGGNASHNGTGTSRGGGGAGGSYAAKTITPASGTYSYIVGAGGAGGNNGNATYFGSTTTVYAQGGAAGEDGNKNNGAGGLGSVASSIGDQKRTGGDGGHARVSGSGGGGGGAGSAEEGKDATNNTPGGSASEYGGSGGDGLTSTLNGSYTGNPGFVYGGGGSGAIKIGNVLNATGGSGANGKVRVSFSSLPLVMFSATTTSQTELATTINIGITLSSASASTVTVPFSINSSSTALGGGIDYTLNTTSPITITAGNTSGTVSVAIIQDADYEDDETIIIDLGSPTNAALGTPNSHTVTIVNDEPVPNLILAVSPSNICIGESFTLTASSVKCANIDYYEYSSDGGNTWYDALDPAGVCSTTHTPSAVGNYQYRYYNFKGVSSNTVSVSVNSLPSITDVTATNNPICPFTTTTITANGVGGTNAVLTWWTGAGGTGTNLGSSNPLTVGSGTYYARVTGTCSPAVEASITITATDIVNPTISVSEDTITQVVALDSDAPVFVDIASQSTTTFADNCSAVLSNNSPYKTSDADASGNYILGQTDVTWTATDPSSNTATAIQRVVVASRQGLSITCPAGGDLGCNPSTPTAGTATTTTTWPWVLSGITNRTVEAVSGCSHTYTIWYVAQWKIFGKFNSRKDSCAQVFTYIVDAFDPTFTTSCPVDQVVNANHAGCTYLQNTTDWDMSATDDCATTPSVYYTTLYGVTTGGGTPGTHTTLNGVTFNPGETTVTWTAVDNCGKTKTCDFTVTVNSISVSVALVGTEDCPDLIPDQGFNPENGIDYDAGTTQVVFSVTLNNSDETSWRFDYNIDASEVVRTDVASPSPNPQTGSDVPVTGSNEKLMTFYINNRPGAEINPIFNVTEVTTDNYGCVYSTTQTATVTVKAMPVVGAFN